MARNKLRDTQIKAFDKPGVYGDGDGLYLRVSTTGSRSWVYIWIRQGRRKEIGLGSYGSGTGQVSLANARIKAEEARTILGTGGDPATDMVERKTAKKIATFGECSDDFIEAMKPTWSNDKHIAQWEMTLKEYAKPLRKLAIADVTTDDVVRSLKPIWTTKPETAARTRGRIEKVLDYAKARGLRSGENPARWKGHLDHILAPRNKLSRGHHAAMPFSDVAQFMQDLKLQKGTGARALEFTILTAARSGESRNATWAEFDIEEKLWVVPAERMKAKREHRVPLSERAMEIILAMKQTELSDMVFPGQEPRKPLSDMSLAAVLKRMEKPEFTVHGFRSSFRDWAAENTNFPRELAEQALAHIVGDATERAYRRGDALLKRRKLMDAWAGYLKRKPDGKVLDFNNTKHQASSI